MLLFAFYIKISFQINLIFIGLRVIKDYYKRPGGVVGDIWKGTFGCAFFYVGPCVMRE